MPARRRPVSKANHRRLRVMAAALVAMGLTAILRSNGYADGAIAFGEYGEGGWASGYASNTLTEADARTTAMVNCNARGYNCIVRSTFKDTCAALAVQDGGNGWAISLSENPDLAQADVQQRCHSYGLPCSIQTVFCDGNPSTPGAPAPPTSTPGGSPCERFPKLC